MSPHEPIVADGSSQGRFEVLEVEVVDAFGKPVDDVPVGLGGRGEFRPALPISPGHWALPYRPPRVSEDTTEQVVITAGPATTKVELVLRARRLSVSLGLKGGRGSPAVAWDRPRERRRASGGSSAGPSSAWFSTSTGG